MKIENRLVFCDFLKVIACLLIVNFHSDILYPDSLSILAFGGDLGNNIFFAISGFLLYDSIMRTSAKGFLGWYFRRLKRLVPMLIVFYLASIVVKAVHITGIYSFVKAFVFPTIYWFTGAILFFYLFIYWVIKIIGEKWIYCLIVGFVIIHLIFDGLFVERYIVGFSAMIIGCFLKKYKALYENLDRKSKIVTLVGLIFTFVFYIILKLLLAKRIECFGVIHLCIGVCTILVACLLIILGCSMEHSLFLWTQKHQVSYNIINYLANATLQVYLVQGFADRILLVNIKQYVVFPLSYIICLFSVLILAVAISIFETKIRDCFKRGKT